MTGQMMFGVFVGLRENFFMGNSNFLLLGSRHPYTAVMNSEYSSLFLLTVEYELLQTQI